MGCIFSCFAKTRKQQMANTKVVKEDLKENDIVQLDIAKDIVKVDENTKNKEYVDFIEHSKDNDLHTAIEVNKENYIYLDIENLKGNDNANIRKELQIENQYDEKENKKENQEIVNYGKNINKPHFIALEVNSKENYIDNNKEIQEDNDYNNEVILKENIVMDKKEIKDDIDHICIELLSLQGDEYYFKLVLEIRRLNTEEKRKLLSLLLKNDDFDKFGYPNFGNTCYLNVGLQLLKLANFYGEFINNFDLNDELFLNLFIILKYWNPKNKLREVHFRKFQNLFFQFNDAFTKYKGNDSCSFLLHILKLNWKSLYNINNMCELIDEELKPIDDNEDCETIEKNISICNKMKEEYPSLFHFYFYSTIDLGDGLQNEVEVYFQITHDNLKKYKFSIEKKLQSLNDRKIIFPSKFFIIKLPNYHRNDEFQLEKSLSIPGYKHKNIYELIFVSYILGSNDGKGGHTYCICNYTSKWYKFEDSYSEEYKSEQLKGKNAYLLIYNLKN